jgi:hypothetical protein
MIRFNLIEPFWRCYSISLINLLPGILTEISRNTCARVPPCLSPKVARWDGPQSPGICHNSIEKKFDILQGIEKQCFAMDLSINGCQERLSKLLTLLSPGGEPIAAAIDQALAACETMLADMTGETPVWMTVMPIQYKLKDAKIGSAAFGQFQRRFKKAGFPRAEQLAQMVLLDSAVTAIRQAQSSLSTLQVQSAAEQSVGGLGLP